VLDTLVIDKPEQLKALTHPLRVRVLEMLGQEDGWQLTNRELALKLGVDPGHLHFHVRMLLKAGLIELVDNGRGHGREKPYRAVARTFRVAPELLASSGARDIQAAMIEEVQQAHAAFAGSTEFRGAQSRVKLTVEEALELMRTGLVEAREREQDDLEKVVVTVFVHPSSAAE
jgi:DNA-binding transcriptional ArsR family regulator